MFKRLHGRIQKNHKQKVTSLEYRKLLPELFGDQKKRLCNIHVFIPEYFFGRNNNNVRQNTNILIKLVKLLYFLNTADSSGTNLWVN